MTPTPETEIITRVEKLQNTLVGNKTITDFLTDEIESPKNNPYRKECLQEITELFKKKQSQPLRNILLFYAVSKEIKKYYDINQMILTLISTKSIKSKIPVCQRYLRLPTIHQK